LTTKYLEFKILSQKHWHLVVFYLMVLLSSGKDFSEGRVTGHKRKRKSNLNLDIQKFTEDDDREFANNPDKIEFM
jgi:hypothetical protein